VESEENEEELILIRHFPAYKAASMELGRILKKAMKKIQKKKKIKKKKMKKEEEEQKN